MAKRVMMDLGFIGHLKTIPSSPRWNNESCDYPNKAGQVDYESCLEAREDINSYTISLRKCCECDFGNCEFGRVKLSKKQLTGCIKGKSLCGLTELEHEINRKRSEMMSDDYHTSTAHWYYDSDEDEEDEEFEDESSSYESDEDEESLEEDEEESDEENEEDEEESDEESDDEEESDEESDEEDDQLELEKQMELTRVYDNEGNYALVFSEKYLSYLRGGVCVM